MVGMFKGGTTILNSGMLPRCSLEVRLFYSDPISVKTATVHTIVVYFSKPVFEYITIYKKFLFKSVTQFVHR